MTPSRRSVSSISKQPTSNQQIGATDGIGIPFRFSRILAVFALTLAAGLIACQPGSEPLVEPLPERSNILLITVDTLRADHLSSYGYSRETSPVIDRLAAEGVRFDQPAVQWPKTGPSFASMFTSTYPKDNGIVRKIGTPIPCRFQMLAEKLQRDGYQTHAIVANAALAKDFYFDQGFDTFIETWKLDGESVGEDPNIAEVVTELAIGLLDRIEEQQTGSDTDKPYFLWVHYLDPHAPYTPPKIPIPSSETSSLGDVGDVDDADSDGDLTWSNLYQDDQFFDPSVRITIADKPRQQMTGIGRDQVLDGRDELAFYVARYDAEIRYTDYQIGRFLDEVKARGLDRRTLTAFTSDHGESLGEHRYYFDHGRFGFQTCARVPLILHYPEAFGPRVDPHPVELIDLAPTILEAAGIELEQSTWNQGRSLTPRLRGEGVDGQMPGQGELAFSEAGWETHHKWQKIVRDERFKLIYAQTAPEQRWIGGEGVRFTLFDLQNDPEETVNVADQFPEDLERLKRQLSQWQNAQQFPVLTDPSSEGCEDERGMEQKTEDLLKSLGYLQ